MFKLRDVCIDFQSYSRRSSTFGAFIPAEESVFRILALLRPAGRATYGNTFVQDDGLVIGRERLSNFRYCDSVAVTNPSRLHGRYRWRLTVRR